MELYDPDSVRLAPGEEVQGDTYRNILFRADEPGTYYFCFVSGAQIIPQHQTFSVGEYSPMFKALPWADVTLPVSRVSYDEVAPESSGLGEVTAFLEEERCPRCADVIRERVSSIRGNYGEIEDPYVVASLFDIIGEDDLSDVVLQTYVRWETRPDVIRRDAFYDVYENTGFTPELRDARRDWAVPFGIVTQLRFLNINGGIFALESDGDDAILNVASLKWKDIPEGSDYWLSDLDGDGDVELGIVGPTVPVTIF